MGIAAGLEAVTPSALGVGNATTLEGEELTSIVQSSSFLTTENTSGSGDTTPKPGKWNTFEKVLVQGAVLTNSVSASLPL